MSRRFFLLSFFIWLLCLSACSHATKVESKKGHQVPPKRGKLIVLDPGHGGYDLGASCSHIVEKKLALITALYTKKHLTNMGYKVVMTRTKDLFIPLKKRVSIANRARADLLVSVHYNAAHHNLASGMEVFYYKLGNKGRAHASKKLASCVLSSMVSETKSQSRGVKEGNFHVLREAQMPSILIEGGFITNRAEAARLSDAAYLDKIAKSIAEGIRLYLSRN